MNKQRLLELAGITEASALNTNAPWVVIDIIDGMEAEVFGPFHTEEQANEYGEWLSENVGSEQWFVSRIQKPDYNG